MAKKLEPCSVLICVYKGDKPKYLVEALESILNQTMPPDDIVVVVDGAIPKMLEQTLDDFAKKYHQINIVRLPHNIGVGPASNEGLKRCRNELVAKMDADDISAPDRLEKQLTEFKKRKSLILLGGQMTEFINDDVNNVVSCRRVPTTEASIRKFAKRRSPFNNITVMFKKSAILAAGGYPKLNRSEDYYLYSKLIAEGQVVDNLKSILAYCRTDDDLIKRRKTWEHTKAMIGARNEIRRLGILTWWDLALVAIAQFGLFLMPTKLAKKFYRKVRK